jgi:hypothetical protein
MAHKDWIGIFCVAIMCASGGASAQGASDGSGTTGRSAKSSDQAASSGKQATTKRGAAPNSKSESANGLTSSPAGGLAHPKDISPGTYNQSGAAVPRTTDPMQTKNTRDGTPLPGASPRASSAAASGTKK